MGEEVYLQQDTKLGRRSLQLQDIVAPPASLPTGSGCSVSRRRLRAASALNHPEHYHDL